MDRKMTLERLAYSPVEVARLIQVSKGTAYALARKIGARCGSRWLVSRERLDEWLANGGSVESVHLPSAPGKVEATPAPTLKARSSRVMQALELRRSGKTYDAIGEALGVTRERARQMLYPFRRELPPRVTGCGPGKLRKDSSAAKAAIREVSLGASVAEAAKLVGVARESLSRAINKPGALGDVCAARRDQIAQELGRALLDAGLDIRKLSAALTALREG